MATNYSSTSRDYPSREDINEYERRSDERDREISDREQRVQDYIKNRPSASWAEAEYKTRR